MRIARRELGYRAAAADGERRLARAARSGERVLAGPFLGEVGFEILYWIPYLRAALRRHAIPRERVTVLTRGGAGAWYRDFAADAVDALDLVGVAEFRRGLAERWARAGDRKLLTVDPFDSLLLERARAQTGDAVELHPQAMYGRLRPFWAAWRPTHGIAALLEHRRLSRPARPAGLPERYAVVKAYFGDALPDTSEARAALAAVVAALRERLPVVLLTAGAPLDDHTDWDELAADAVVAPAQPAVNLAEQTAALAHAELLVAPYGGFSYLGPLLGVPTLALRVEGGDNPVHLATFQASGLAERFVLGDPARPDELARAAASLLEAA